MNYFLNENIFTLNSGTEFSAVKRLQLFKKNGQKAKILTRNYNTNGATDNARVGLDTSDVLNMYDYFQELVNLPKVDMELRYTDAIDKSLYHIEGIDANESLIKYHGKTVGKVLVAPATIGLVGSIEWYNDNMVILARDIWDRRGFKSSTQYFHPDGNLGPQIFFDINGQPKIELTRMNINGQLAPTSWKLLSYKGKAWRFNSEEELFTFFCSELAKEESSSFISDRPSLFGSLVRIEGAAGRWQVLHNVHALDNRQAGASRKVLPYLEPIFGTFADKFDGIIVATEQQRDEIRKYFNFKQVLALPDTYADDFSPVERALPAEAEIVSLGRMAADRGSIDAVEVFAKVHQQLQNATLSFYGYASPADYQMTIENRMNELGLGDFVKFKGYHSEEELAQFLPQAHLLLNTSEGEGFGMNVLKGLSYGLPAVGYKVKYGLSEMIEDGKNGQLVPLKNVQAAADAIVSILSDAEKYKAYSEAAFNKAQEFNADKVWTRWLETQQAVNHLFVKA